LAYMFIHRIIQTGCGDRGAWPWRTCHFSHAWSACGPARCDAANGPRNCRRLCDTPLFLSSIDVAQSAWASRPRSSGCLN